MYSEDEAVQEMSGYFATSAGRTGKENTRKHKWAVVERKGREIWKRKSEPGRGVVKPAQDVLLPRVNLPSVK